MPSTHDERRSSAAASWPSPSGVLNGGSVAVVVAVAAAVAYCLAAVLGIGLLWWIGRLLPMEGGARDVRVRSAEARCRQRRQIIAFWTCAGLASSCWGTSRLRTDGTESLVWRAIDVSVAVVVVAGERVPGVTIYLSGGAPEILYGVDRRFGGGLADELGLKQTRAGYLCTKSPTYCSCGLYTRFQGLLPNLNR